MTHINDAPRHFDDTNSADLWIAHTEAQDGSSIPPLEEDYTAIVEAIKYDNEIEEVASYLESRQAELARLAIKDYPEN